MKQYLDLLANVLDDGTDKADRTGVGTRSQFGRQIRMKMSDGFPLLTTKRVFWKGVVAELLWFISGSTNVRSLQEQGVTIWNEWADQNGDLGPVYGKQWRGWNTGQTSYGTSREVDQLKGVLDELQKNPDSRRLIVSAWNVTDLPKMALAPCHCLFQFNTRPNGAGPRILDLQLYQRSADIFLGVPFNVASYALLLHLVARHVGMIPGEFVHTFGDLHLYANHFEQAETQLARRPIALPSLGFSDDAPTSLFEIRPEHLRLHDYTPMPAISAPVAV